MRGRPNGNDAGSVACPGKRVDRGRSQSVRPQPASSGEGRNRTGDTTIFRDTREVTFGPESTCKQACSGFESFGRLPPGYRVVPGGFRTSPGGRGPIESRWSRGEPQSRDPVSEGGTSSAIDFTDPTGTDP